MRRKNKITSLIVNPSLDVDDWVSGPLIANRTAEGAHYAHVVSPLTTRPLSKFDPYNTRYVIQHKVRSTSTSICLACPCQTGTHEDKLRARVGHANICDQLFYCIRLSRTR